MSKDRGEIIFKMVTMVRIDNGNWRECNDSDAEWMMHVLYKCSRGGNKVTIKLWAENLRTGDVLTAPQDRATIFGVLPREFWPQFALDALDQDTNENQDSLI